MGSLSRALRLSIYTFYRAYRGNLSFSFDSVQGAGGWIKVGMSFIQNVKYTFSKHPIKTNHNAERTAWDEKSFACHGYFILYDNLLLEMLRLLDQPDLKLISSSEI